MPCSKGMRSCHHNCLHRSKVMQYRDAVDAREKLRESGEIETRARGGAGAAVAMYQLSDEEFDELHPPILFKDWLKEWDQRYERAEEESRQ